MVRVAITGGRGLVGEMLSKRLMSTGHDVHVVTRSPQSPTDIAWDPDKGTLEADRIELCDVVVHLAGESIFGRWNEKKKRAILRSRVDSTLLLSQSMANMDNPPVALICASATGYYGDRGDEILTEKSSPGTGFLAEVCQAWEAACEPAQKAALRVVNVRSGVALSLRGGMLRFMQPLFKMGLGGRAGSGKQWLSWIALDDLVDIYLTAVVDAELTGPINGVAPNPVTNKAFTRTLGRVVRRPAILHVPRFGLRRVFGPEAAEDIVLSSARVHPQRLQERNFEFQFPELEPALKEIVTSRGTR